MKKILFMLFITFMLISVVSAATWDNIKSYDQETNTVKFSNSFLRIIPLDSIGNATLETPQVYQVRVGYSKIAQFKINPYEDYPNILEKIDLIDLKTGVTSVRKIDIKYLGLEDYVVDDYTCDNKTGECLISGNHTEKREAWINWDKNAYRNKEVTVGLFMNIGDEETFEWIPTIAGVKVSEWAVVTSGAVTTTDGAYTTVAYLNNGTFNTTSAISIDYMVLAGGGGGGTGGGAGGGGGGGAGGLLNSTGYTLPAGNYKIIVGDGGAATTKGQNSTIQFFNGTKLIDANGGGDGGDFNSGAGGVGGSGGGGARDTGSGAAGTSGQGNSGANAIPPSGGGGGSKSSGIANASGGFGGQGFNFSLNGTTLCYGGGAGAEAGKGYCGGANGYNFGGNSVKNGEDGRGGGGSDGGGTGGTGGSGIVFIKYLSASVTVEMISPEDTANFTNNLINFSVNVTDVVDVSIVNVSLIVNGTINQTNSTGISDIYYFNTSTFADGFYNWTVIAFGNDSIQYNSSNGTFTFTLDSTAPVVSNDNITNLFTTSLPVNLTWNYSASDTHLDSCYYNWTGNASYTTVTCNSPIITSIATEGNNTFQYCANDTFGFESCGINYSYVTLGNISQADNPDPVGEGDTVTFNLTINVTSIPSTNATLILNNTVFYPDTIVAGTNGYFFEKEVTIPLGWGNATGYNQSWLWNYTISGITTNSTTNSTNLTVFSLAIDDCSTYGTVIFNMTLRDETNGSLLNASAGSSIELDLQLTGKGNTSVTQQFNHTYTNTNYAPVCVPTGLLNNSDYRVDIVGEYSATSFVTEFFYLDNGTLNSSSFLDPFTNKTVNIYDLNSSDSTTFLFSFLDQDNVEVPNAIVHVFRQYIGDGVFREVERGKQDNNGQTHLHLVEEDVIYFFKMTLNGELLFTSTTYNAKCLSSPCEIELSASEDTPQFDTNFTGIGGSYEITTFPSQRIVMLQFALNDPATMNLTLVKQNYDGGVTFVNTTSVTSSGSSLNLSIPQSAGNVTFYAIVYKDGEFLSYKGLNLQEAGYNYFGTTGLIMAALMVMALVLMAVFEGAGVIVFLIFALFIAAGMKILDLGYYSLIGLICALVILIFKLVQKRR